MSVIVATATLDKKLHSKTTTEVSKPAGFGAYGDNMGVQQSLIDAIDKPPASKVNGSLDFADKDKRWLRELGVTTTTPLDFRNAWGSVHYTDHQKHLKWSESYTGRLAIRSVSRGIIGCAFYSLANIYGSKQLGNYDLQKDPENVLQHITRFIDNTAGKGIQKVVKAVTGDEVRAQKFTLFRDTRNYGNVIKLADGTTQAVMGRSLGHEAMAVTFDFATMSFFDYMMRYFIGLLDPNARDKWMKDGHIVFPEALKDLLKNVFRGVTYAAGEDMAVAIPYVFLMRKQRNFFDKLSPGFKYDADKGLNGGSYKIDGNGHIIGNYNAEGMLDLMSRFSWYNVGTKMFRDAYTTGERKLLQWQNGDHKIALPALDPSKSWVDILRAGVHKIGDGVLYALSTTIKTMMYMIPASFTFAAIRTSQSKTRGLAINAEKGVLGRMTRESEAEDPGINAPDNSPEDSKKYTFKAVKPGSRVSTERPNISKERRGKEFFFKKGDEELTKAEYRNIWRSIKNNPDSIANPFQEGRESAFSNETNNYYKNSAVAPWHDKFINPIGLKCYQFGKKLNDGFLAPMYEKLGITDTPRLDKLKRFSHTYADAATAYTPYFMLKTDILSEFWDIPRMDMGIRRGLIGAAHFSWGEFRAGCSEVFRTIRHEPFTDPVREEEAKQKMWDYGARASNEAHQLNDVPEELNDKQESRIEKKKLFTTEQLKAQRPTYNELRNPTVPTNWGNHEMMKRAEGPVSLEQSVPRPTSGKPSDPILTRPRQPSWAAQHDAMKQPQDITVPQGYTVH